MNAVEIEEAISQLADQPFNPKNSPYAFLEAFGNKETTIKRLRSGASNKSDLGVAKRPSRATPDTPDIARRMPRDRPVTRKYVPAKTETTCAPLGTELWITAE